jgi:hypothetical protein
MARSEAKQKEKKIIIFETKLRFALLASLSAAVFREIRNDNLLVA